jgi:hypothetical protein
MDKLGLQQQESVADLIPNLYINFSKEGKTSFIEVEQASITIASNFTDDNKSLVIKELKARGRKAYRNVPMTQESLDIL